MVASPVELSQPQQSAASLTRRHLAKRSIVLLLCFVGFVQFLPSEPFLVDFLLSKGLSHEQVTDDIFPLWIVFRLPALMLNGLLAELLGNAIVVLLGACFGLVTVVMTCFCHSLTALQVTQLTVAVSMTAHIGPLYALVFELSSGTRASYQANVHWVKAVVVFSNFAAGIAGSTMRYTLHASYMLIWQVSLVTQLLALGFAICLPGFTRGLRATRLGAAGANVRSSGASWSFLTSTWQPMPASPPMSSNSCGRVSHTWSWELMLDVLRSYRLQGVAEWTLWAIVAHTAHVMVATYWQALVRAKGHRPEDSNGFVSAASFLLAVLVLVALAKAPVLSNRKNRWWIITLSLLAGGIAVLSMGVFPEVWQVYMAYIAYQATFELSGAVSTHQVGAEVLEHVAQMSSPRALGRSEEGPRKPRIALLISVNQLFSSLVQMVVQYGFKKCQSGHHPLSMARRFVILGAGLLIGAAGYALWRMVAWMMSSVMRPRCRAHSEQEQIHLGGPLRPF